MPVQNDKQGVQRFYTKNTAITYVSDVYGFADPGGDDDDFAIILARLRNGRAVVFAAKTYQLSAWGNNFDNILKDIQSISYEHNVRLWVCEKNSLGSVIISDMRNMGINVLGLVTGTRDMRPDTRYGSKAKTTTYDKDTAVERLRKCEQQGLVQIVKGGDKYIQKLRMQAMAYGRTASGKWKGLGEHDDLVSCLLLLVAYAYSTFLRFRGKGNLQRTVSAKHESAYISSRGQKQMEAIKATLKRRNVKYDRFYVK